MPSKGVKCFAYIAVSGIEIEFSVPKQSVTKRHPDQFTIDHLEVDSKHLRAFKFSGRFSFKVRRDGRQLAEQWVDVNSMTGALENGTMNNMDQTPSIFVEDLIVAYGFYDAGPGIAGLPKQHLCYVTVTKNYEDWMRDVAPPDTDKADRPFHKMVLPSSHDIGMNSLQTAQALLQKSGTGIIKEVLGRSLPSAFEVINKVSDSAINHIAPDIIRALAVTQKDSLDTILKIGARYFEFRPAHCHRQMQKVSPLEDTVYFQHGAIPGMLYKQFLHDIVDFLGHHRDEIVVVQNRWDGVPADCPRASDDELRDILNDVLRDKDLQVGNQDDMMRMSIKDLRNERKRLIITRDVNQVSNYDDLANATLDGSSMLAKLEDMGRKPPKGHPITLLQCQATATNIRDVIVASVLDSDVSTSPLLATKPICDQKILPLLRGQTGRDLTREESVVVILNDFFDGGTADVAVQLCRERIG
ncbi:PLC-like phosphodiesterase [Lindgomyces ingoldianus]|uniref:PLC-like phosphodiesterase n=1 Tax=Lindgomyces ingoldianus TaxID=673940 RepID=A0ACB6QNE7_9PLEO|nr:PLC-like phosphodiesterase [Lindgomyces ingoldianus]KAF2468544.1 PLC-like phosphodiesterase [Lindgomyces ingoldianus]